MAERLLYGHRTGQARTGYQILAASGPRGNVDQYEDVLRWLESLRIHPDMLSQHYGWIWLGVGSGRRIFGRIASDHARSGGRTLEARLIRLNERECDAIAWQPFHLEECIARDEQWQMDEHHRLPPVDLPTDASRATGGVAAERPSGLQLSWPLFGGTAAALLREAIQQMSLRQRRTFSFAAPAGQDHGEIDVLFLAATTSHTPKTRDRPRDEAVAPLPRRRPLTLVLGILCLISLIAAYWLTRENTDLKRRAAEQVNELKAKDQQIDKLLDQRDEKPATIVESASGRDARALAAQLFTEIYPEPPGSSARDLAEQWQRVSHYLLNRGEASDELDILENGLASWLEFERSFSVYQQRLQRTADLLPGVSDQLDDLETRLSRLRRIIAEDTLVSPRHEKLAAEISTLLEQLRGSEKSLAEILRPPANSDATEPDRKSQIIPRKPERPEDRTKDGVKSR